MANEFTLLDYELTAPPLTAAVVRTWREASPIMDMLKFKVSDNLSEKVLRYNTLPTVPWRKVGASFSNVKVNPTPIDERLHFMGAQIDIPYEYVKAKSIQDIRADQTEAILKAAAFGFNEAFFTNVPAVDEDALYGIWGRVQDLGSGQNVNGGSLDISPDTVVANWQHKLIDLIEELLMQVDGNPGDKVLFANRTVLRRMASAFRQSNLLDTTTDQLGRQFMTYGKGGPKIVDVGYKLDQTSYVLPDTENSGGTALTGSTLSSIFCVRFGEPYLSGWCQEMPTADDVGLTEDRVNYRTVVRFSPGLFMTHPRSIARAYAIQAA